MRLKELYQLFDKARKLNEELIEKSNSPRFLKGREEDWSVHAEWSQCDSPDFYDYVLELTQKEVSHLEILCAAYFEIVQHAVKGEIKLKIEDSSVYINEHPKRYRITVLTLVDNLGWLTTLSIPTLGFMRKKEKMSYRDTVRMTYTPLPLILFGLRKNLVTDYWNKKPHCTTNVAAGLYEPNVHLRPKKRKLHMLLDKEDDPITEVQKFKSCLLNQFIPMISPLTFTINELIYLGQERLEKQEANKREEENFRDYKKKIYDIIGREF